MTLLALFNNSLNGTPSTPPTLSRRFRSHLNKHPYDADISFTTFERLPTTGAFIATSLINDPHALIAFDMHPFSHYELYLLPQNTNWMKDSLHTPCICTADEVTAEIRLHESLPKLSHQLMAYTFHQTGCQTEKDVTRVLQQLANVYEELRTLPEKEWYRFIHRVRQFDFSHEDTVTNDVFPEQLVTYDAATAFIQKHAPKSYTIALQPYLSVLLDAIQSINIKSK